MVKYSDDTNYEMIELANLFDLDKARIVQAQINSIDSANNCANITFSSECVELAGLSVDAVKFFYHCENSTGTEEDLANGHKAFKANEYVYCLWCPASPTIDERFFIIGHVDIRGTKKCIVPEILYLLLPGNAATGNVYGLFDTSTGDLLDLDDFVNIDESSPAKPSSPIGVWSTAFYSWLVYNLNVSISYTIPSHTCTIRLPNNMYSATATGETTTNYTGTTGWISSSNPVDCEEWFDAGNGQFSTTASRTFHNSYPDLYDIEGDQTCTFSMTDPYGSHADQGDNTCTACWGSTQYNNVRRMRSGSIPHNGMRIWDGADSVAYIVELSFENTFTDTNITTLADGVFAASATSSFEATFSANFTSIAPASPSVSISSTSTQTYQLNAWPPYGATEFSTTEIAESGTVIYNGISVSSAFMRPDICDIWAEIPAPLTMGSNGAYIIVCGAVFYKMAVADGGLFSGYGGEQKIGPDRYTTVAIPGGRGVGFGVTWQARSTDTGHFKVFPCAVASMYAGDFTGAAGTSVTDILNNANSSISSGLSRSVSAIYDFMSNRCNAVGMNAAAVQSFYSAYILGRISVMPMKRKGI